MDDGWRGGLPVRGASILLCEAICGAGSPLFYSLPPASDAQYLGAEGTTTLLHRDVYSSYSWSTNLLGRKRWTLFPPSHASFLRRHPDDPRSQLVPDVRDIDERVFLHWRRAKEAMVEVVQEEGETIFVPSGWYR